MLVLETDDVFGSERARGRGPDRNKENADVAMGSKYSCFIFQVVQMFAQCERGLLG